MPCRSNTKIDPDRNRRRSFRVGDFAVHACMHLGVNYNLFPKLALTHILSVQQMVWIFIFGSNRGYSYLSKQSSKAYSSPTLISTCSSGAEACAMGSGNHEHKAHALRNNALAYLVCTHMVD